MMVLMAPICNYFDDILQRLHTTTPYNEYKNVNTSINNFKKMKWL